MTKREARRKAWAMVWRFCYTAAGSDEFPDVDEDDEGKIALELDGIRALAARWANLDVPENTRGQTGEGATP